METKMPVIHNLNAFRGYPMYFTHKEKEGEHVFTLANDSELSINDELLLDKRKYRVIEIIEKRKAVGNYIGERPDFYKLKAEIIISEL